MSNFTHHTGSTVTAAPEVTRSRTSLRHMLLAAVLLVSTTVVATTGGLVASQVPASATPPPPTGDGVLFAWGSNSRNALGLPFTLSPPALSSVPVATHVAQDGYTVRAASAGVGNAFVATNSDSAFGWGYNDEGELGNGTVDGPTSQTVDYSRVVLPRGVSLATVSSGAFHSLGLDTNGQVWAWGEGEFGLLGQGNQNDGLTAVPVTLPTVRAFDPPVTAVAIAAGGSASWAVGSNGRIYEWGTDHAGSDACSSATAMQCSFRPTLVPDLTDVVNVEAGSFDSATALGADGMVWRLLGSTAPVPLANGIAFGTQIASGSGASYVIGLDGRVYAWGNGYWGQLGDGTQNVNHVNDLVEVRLPVGVHAVAISATSTNGYAIGDDKKLYAWGANSSGELGIGSTTGPQTVCGGQACSTTPVQVALPANYVPVGLPSEGQAVHSAYAILQHVSPAPTISAGSASIVEGDSGTRVLKIPVTLSSASNTTITVKFTLRGAPNNGTATGAKKAAPGIDFLDNGGVTKTLTFKPTSTGRTPVKKYISVKVVGDTIAESNETLTVQLTNPSSGYVLAQSTATATILNND